MGTLFSVFSRRDWRMARALARVCGGGVEASAHLTDEGVPYLIVGEAIIARGDDGSWCLTTPAEDVATGETPADAIVAYLLTLGDEVLATQQRIAEALAQKETTDGTVQAEGWQEPILAG